MRASLSVVAIPKVSPFLSSLSLCCCCRSTAVVPSSSSCTSPSERLQTVRSDCYDTTNAQETNHCRLNVEGPLGPYLELVLALASCRPSLLNRLHNAIFHLFLRTERYYTDTISFFVFIQEYVNVCCTYFTWMPALPCVQIRRARIIVPR